MLDGKVEGGVALVVLLHGHLPECVHEEPEAGGAPVLGCHVEGCPPPLVFQQDSLFRHLTRFLIADFSKKQSTPPGISYKWYKSKC